MFCSCVAIWLYIMCSVVDDASKREVSTQSRLSISRVAQRAYLEVEYIRNVLSVSGTLKYADSGTA